MHMIHKGQIESVQSINSEVQFNNDNYFGNISIRHIK